jgi:argininosuccinate synthase
LGKAQYSINKGLWDKRGGKETLTSNQPLPSDAYPLNYKRRRRKVTLQFEKEN